MSTEQTPTDPKLPPVAPPPTRVYFHLLTPNIKSPELHALNVRWVRHQGDIAMVDLDPEEDKKLIGQLRGLIKGGMLKLSEISAELHGDKKKLPLHVPQDQRLRLRLFDPQLRQASKGQTGPSVPPARADQVAAVATDANAAPVGAGSASSSIRFKNAPLQATKRVDMGGDWPPM